MKKILFLIILVVFTIPFAYSKSYEQDVPYITFSGKTYGLLYSKKSEESGGYFNEYYKKGEGYTNWSELISVMHSPNEFSPIEFAKEFCKYLKSRNLEYEINIDEDNNVALINFIIINRERRPIILENNIFKYEKDRICGTINMQYAQRYVLPNPLGIDKVKKQIAKSNKKYLKKVEKMPIPDVLMAEIDNGVYLDSTEAVIEPKN